MSQIKNKSESKPLDSPLFSYKSFIKRSFDHVRTQALFRLVSLYHWNTFGSENQIRQKRKIVLYQTNYFQVNPIITPLEILTPVSFLTHNNLGNEKFDPV